MTQVVSQNRKNREVFLSARGELRELPKVPELPKIAEIEKLSPARNRQSRAEKALRRINSDKRGLG
jgi:hypothetical protein